MAKGRLRKAGVAVGVATLTALLGIAVPLLFGGTETRAPRKAVLSAPFSIRLAEAAPVTSAAFPTGEAHWAAYLKLNQAIDLEQITSNFSGLTTITPTHVIGPINASRAHSSVSIIDAGPFNNLPRAKMYVDTDGWIVVYSTFYDVGFIVQWPAMDTDNPAHCRHQSI